MGPRVDVDWKDLNLTQKVAEGYGAAARPLPDVIQDVVAARKDKLPVLVWFCRPDQSKQNTLIEEKVFGDEKIAIAMKKFVCLQGNVSNVPAGKLKTALTKSTPALYLYDPAGKSFQELTGSTAASSKKVYAAVKALWEKSFKTKLRDFTRKITGILDKLEKIEAKLITVEIKRSRARGSKSRLKACDREEAKLEKEEKKLNEDEAKLLADVKLKDDFAS